MPGTQPRGTHAFDPSGSSSQSAQMLDVVNAEEDGAEDQDGPPLDLSLANIPGASAFPLVTPDLGILASGATPSVVSSLPSLDPSSSGGVRPPPSSSSLLPTVHPNSTQLHDISMGSVNSRDTNSDADSSQLRKRKHDGRSASGTRPPSSKRSSKSKTSDLNPVIISNALNSTLNRLADVMEKSLDANATAIAPAAPPGPPATMIPNTTPPIDPSFNFTSPIESQTTQPSSMASQPLGPLSNPPSASHEEILNQAITIATSDDSLSEDELLAASLFFTSASEDAVRAARTFVALSNNNQVVQRRFLLRQLDTAALLPGRGKGKAVEDGDDHSMTY